MTQKQIDPWHDCRRTGTNTDSPGPFSCVGYYICMGGIERKKNKKEKKSILKTIAGEAIIAAGALAALHAAAESKKTPTYADKFPALEMSDDKPSTASKSGDHAEWKKFRQKDTDIEDRREHTSFRITLSHEPIDIHKQLAEDAKRKVLENSKLAADLGIHHIGKTPKQVLSTTADKRKAQIDAAIKKTRDSVMSQEKKKK